MNILITGCAGFIGSAFALKILKTNKKIKFNLLYDQNRSLQEKIKILTNVNDKELEIIYRSS